MSDLDYQEIQAMLGRVMGTPEGGPEKPSWFGSASSPEWQTYSNFQDMQKVIQQKALLQSLDQRLNPMTLGEASGYLGIPQDQLANPRQIIPTAYEDVRTPTVVEGPQPTMKVLTSQQVGTRMSDPIFQHTPVGYEEDALFSPSEMMDKPLLQRGMEQDFLDKKAPYYRREEMPNVEPVAVDQVIQGPGAPMPGPDKVERKPTEFGPDANAMVSPLQRGMVNSRLHRDSLQLPTPRNRTDAETKVDLARQYYQDPENHRAEGVVSGAIGADRLVRQTDSGIDLNKAKGDELQARADYSRQILQPKIDSLRAGTAKARQDIVESKTLLGAKRDVMVNNVAKGEAYIKYLESRADGRDAELALKESRVMGMLNEAERKQALAQLQAAKELRKSGDFTDEDFDKILGGIFENLNVKGVQRAPGMIDRITSTLTGEPLEHTDPEVGGVPDNATPQMYRETRSLRQKGGEHTSRSASAPKDAGTVLSELTKELGDLTKLEGKTITDTKTGKKYSVTKGKLAERK